MGLEAFLKKPSTEQGATKLASTIVSAYNPALGALVQAVGSAVYEVEADLGPSATGEAKQTAAVGVVAVQTAKEPKVKSAAATVSIEAVINAIVSLFNALGIFKHKAESPAPAAK